MVNFDRLLVITVFTPLPAIESPMGPGRSPVGMTIDVTHEDDRESRLSRASNLPTPQTVKVKRLERRLDAADDAMARRKQNMGSMTPVRITPRDARCGPRP